MRFNEEELAEFALNPGDHEGRLTHKGPPRTLYDTGQLVFVGESCCCVSNLKIFLMCSLIEKSFYCVYELMLFTLCIQFNFVCVYDLICFQHVCV